MLAIALFSAFLVILGVVERFRHRRYLARIPIRIHVNGTRGKSTVTRLIAAGLRASGLPTLAKTTGTAARLIAEDGSETPYRRVWLAGPPSISEQRRLVRLAAQREVQALVVECMAVHPEIQRVAERDFIRATVCVITNVRQDHADVMGETLNEVAATLALTIPEGGRLVLGADMSASVPAGAVLMREAATRHCTVTGVESAHALSSDERALFPSSLFTANISTALAVCEGLGIARAVALRGMASALPDPGALKILRAENNGRVFWLVDAFAANDATSTLDAWTVCGTCPELEALPVVGLFANRNDRGFRLDDLLDGFAGRVATEPRCRGVVLMGDSLLSARTRCTRTGLRSVLLPTYSFLPFLSGAPASSVPRMLHRALGLLSPQEKELVLFGFGNTKGMGNTISAWFQRHGSALPVTPSSTPETPGAGT